MSKDTTMCRNCQTAAAIVRRLGFNDNIAWGTMGGPNHIIHATHANSGQYMERKETEDEYKRRVAEREAYGGASASFGQVVREYSRSPLCQFYSSEIAWVTASRPTRTTVYMAHPVSGPNFHDNIRNATIWLRYLRRMNVSALAEMTGAEFQQRPLILCPWLAAIEEDEMYPGGREGVIIDARDTVLMFDEVWLVGGRVTEGMHVEAKTARIMRDLSHLGILPGEFAALQEHHSNADMLIKPNGTKPKTKKR